MSALDHVKALSATFSRARALAFRGERVSVGRAGNASRQCESPEARQGIGHGVTPRASGLPLQLESRKMCGQGTRCILAGSELDRAGSSSHEGA